jgi:polyribonucleotide nucleotidyltransferase
MSSLLDAVFIQVFDRTGLLMHHLSGTPYSSQSFLPLRINFSERLSPYFFAEFFDFC